MAVYIALSISEIKYVEYTYPINHRRLEQMLLKVLIIYNLRTCETEGNFHQ